MLTRRPVVLGGLACATVLPGLSACSGGTAEQEAAQGLRRSTAPASSDATAIRHAVVHSATLAPSSHNTQCWRFHIAEGAITIEPDFARRCPAVDPDDHHLFVSLGCATENLVHAALANGLHAEPRADADGRIVVDLAPSRPFASPLFHAIALRQCTRGDYDGHALAPAELRQLEQAGTGDGVSVRLLTERPAIESVLGYVVAGNTAQMDDPAFVAELTAWIRFSAAEALRSGDGLFTGASGNPALPRWLGTRAMRLFFTPKSENERYARQIRNSAGIAVFVSQRSDRTHWVEAGRCYERFALRATALGIRNAFLNPPVEVSAIRPQFAAWLGLKADERPDLVVRFGRGAAMPMSMRRPVQAVLV
ncbi:Acg family FMN-binding oxidoreductase [Roseateles sp.]|uniref:Acg family FMN-binding oxidoreductase n=1 Tax=Roseateles sp. TaxID=1971397 RepID=UPI003262D644